VSEKIRKPILIALLLFFGFTLFILIRVVSNLYGNPSGGTVAAFNLIHGNQQVNTLLELTGTHSPTPFQPLPTETPTPTATSTPTATPTSTSTHTPTPTPTNTPAPTENQRTIYLQAPLSRALKAMRSRIVSHVSPAPRSIGHAISGYPSMKWIFNQGCRFQTIPKPDS